MPRPTMAELTEALHSATLTPYEVEYICATICWLREEEPTMGE